MKKILIALDYDPTAQVIAEKGMTIAKAMGAEVTLLHVMADPVYYADANYSPIMGFTGYMDIDVLQKDVTSAIKKESLVFLERTRQHLADDTIKILVTEGDFADSILDTAKETGAGIIVLGSHSRSWLNDILVGSVTEKVLRKTEIPVYIVPTKEVSL
jgi:nucleotide-binding universal stress UspA family protein